MSNISVELPTLQSLVNVGGTYDAPAHHITFSGITFTGTSFGSYFTGKYPRRHGFVKMDADTRMAPLMAGVLIASIWTGRRTAVHGRYKHFFIVGAVFFVSREREFAVRL